jgi:hypothetical protein
MNVDWFIVAEFVLICVGVVALIGDFDRERS